MPVFKRSDGRIYCIYTDDTGKRVWESFGRGGKAREAAETTGAVPGVSPEVQARRGVPPSLSQGTSLLDQRVQGMTDQELMEKLSDPEALQRWYEQQ